MKKKVIVKTDEVGFLTKGVHKTQIFVEFLHFNYKDNLVLLFRIKKFQKKKKCIILKLEYFNKSISGGHSNNPLILYQSKQTYVLDGIPKSSLNYALPRENKYLLRIRLIPDNWLHFDASESGLMIHSS